MPTGKIITSDRELNQYDYSIIVAIDKATAESLPRGINGSDIVFEFVVDDQGRRQRLPTKMNSTVVELRKHPDGVTEVILASGETISFKPDYGMSDESDVRPGFLCVIESANTSVVRWTKDNLVDKYIAAEAKIIRLEKELAIEKVKNETPSRRPRILKGRDNV